jgi:hypothetical protein
MRKGLWLAAVAILLAVPAASSAEPAHVGYPSSIASTGDSITRAFNLPVPVRRLSPKLLVDGIELSGEQPLPADPRREPRDQRAEL